MSFAAYGLLPMHALPIVRQTEALEAGKRRGERRVGEHRKAACRCRVDNDRKQWLRREVTQKK